MIIIIIIFVITLTLTHALITPIPSLNPLGNQFVDPPVRLTFSS